MKKKTIIFLLIGLIIIVSSLFFLITKDKGGVFYEGGKEKMNTLSFSSRGAIESNIKTIDEKVNIEEVTTLKTTEPTREGTKATYTENSITCYINPENIYLKGYYVSLNQGYLQKGDAEVFCKAEADFLNSKEFLSSEVIATIQTKNPSYYTDAYFYKLENFTDYSIVETTNVEKDDILANYTETILVNQSINGTWFYKNVSYYEPYTIGKNTFYFVKRPFNNTREVKVSSYDLTNGEKIYIRIIGKANIEDTFDLEMCFGSSCNVLPAPVIISTSQTDWNNQSHYNNSASNSTGVILLNHNNYSEIQNLAGLNTTLLDSLFHMDNDTSRGESLATPGKIIEERYSKNGTFSGTGSTNTFNTTNKKIGNASLGIVGATPKTVQLYVNSIKGRNYTKVAWVYPITNAGNILSGDGSHALWFQGCTAGYFCSGHEGSWFPGTQSNTSHGTGRWNLYVATYNGTHLNLYLNGTIVASGSQASMTSSDNTIIGGYFANSNVANGYFDEVSIWNRTLNSSEIAYIYERQYGNFPKEGEYTSKIFDATFTASWKNATINWNNASSQGYVGYQVMSCNDASCSGETWKGTDGTANTYFVGNQTLNTTITPDNRYFRFKVYMNTTNRDASPFVEDFGFGYDEVVGGGSSLCSCAGSGNNWVVNASCYLVTDCKLGVGNLTLLSGVILQTNATLQALHYSRPTDANVYVHKLDGGKFIIGQG